MKKLIVTYAMVLAACAAWGYSSMLFHCTDGSDHLIAVEGLEITVASDILTAKCASGASLVLPVGQIENMQFSDNSSLVDAAVGACEVEVFGLDGIYMGKKASVADAMAELPAGAYVLRASSGKTLKILKGNE